MRFATVSDGRVTASWSPTGDWEDIQGVLAGGIIWMLLDEALSKAVVARDWRALTCELRVRYKRRIGAGEQLRLEGWAVQRRKRRIVTEASLLAEDGVERAHAWGTFLAVD